MSRRITPQRFVLSLACLVLFEGGLSTVGLNNAHRAKADLEKAVPGDLRQAASGLAVPDRPPDRSAPWWSSTTKESALGDLAATGATILQADR